MRVVHEEHPVAQARKHPVHLRAVEPVVLRRRRSLQAVEHPRLVPLGLQPPQPPRPHVRERLVVEVHRVLRGQQHPDPECPRLFEQGEHRLLARRIGRRRQIPENLVHVEHRPQRSRARLRPHPADHLVEQQADKKHPLGITEVRNAENRQTRLALRRVQDLRDVERHPAQPRLKAGRGQQAVHRHRQLGPLLPRIKTFQIHHPHLPERRRLDLLHQPRQRETLAGPPVRTENRAQQNVLAALQRVSIHPDQRQQAGNRALNAVAKHLRIIHHLEGRRLQAAQDAHRNARIAARRVHHHLGFLAQRRNPLAALPPIAQPLFPQGRLGRRKRVRRLPLARCILLVDPRPEILPAQLRKGQQQIRQVPLRIDDDRRDVVHRRLFEQRQTQSRLARAGHAQHHSVRHQILAVIQHQRILQLLRRRIIAATQIKRPELFVIFGLDVHDPHPVPKIRNQTTGKTPARRRPALRGERAASARTEPRENAPDGNDRLPAAVH